LTTAAAGDRPPWVVVGLGNPGREYEETRHNVGLWCIDELARRTGVKLERADRRARLAETQVAGRRVALIASRVYVNESGVAVGYALTRFHSGPERLIVVLDDINLEPGAIRIRRKGSSGGHNGLKSVTAAIGTDEFIRVRIGVGRPGSPEKQVDHVLSEFSRADKAMVREAVKRAADAIDAIVRDGVEQAMNTFN
jgi:PTH1 family peptidyl-tRNA hydrolase